MRKVAGSVLVLLLAAALISVAAACGSSGSSSTSTSPSASTGAKKVYQITLVTDDQFDPYYLTLNRGAQDEAKKLGVKVTFQAPQTPDVPSETSVLQAVMARKPDGLIASAVDAKAMVVPFQAIKNAGVPIIMVDSALADPTIALTSIMSDNTSNGLKAAELMNGLLGGKGKVGYEGYIPGIKSVDDRFNGWKAGLKKYPGLVDIGQQYDKGEIAQAAASTDALLARNPDLAGMFGSWTNATIGVATAVQNAGKAGKVKIVGMDGAPDEVKLLKQGVVSALIVQKVYTMGQLAVQHMVDYLQNGTLPESKEILLDSVAVTPDNVDSPDITPYLYGK